MYSLKFMSQNKTYNIQFISSYQKILVLKVERSLLMCVRKYFLIVGIIFTLSGIFRCPKLEVKGQRVEFFSADGLVHLPARHCFKYSFKPIDFISELFFILIRSRNDSFDKPLFLFLHLGNGNLLISFIYLFFLFFLFLFVYSKPKWFANF